MKFYIKGLMRLFGRSHFSGMHTRDDAFFLAAKKIFLPQGLQIDQVVNIV